ncbi:MCP four helix bundle domain-containing protein (plasmid) [Azospirillum melinis]|uniref:MCP four helix bundle domain-containing protein n=1 Tax=Azospirillum melinis TaxID=328839 RepID=UPI0037574893
MSNLKISMKIMLIVGMLSIVSMTIAGFGAIGLQSLGSAITDLDEATTEVRLSSRLNRLLAEINRNEYSLAIDPGEVGTVSAAIDDRRKAIADAIARLKGTVEGEQVVILQKIERQLPAYYEKLAASIDAARKVQGSFTLNDGQRTIKVAVEASRADVRTLRGDITAFLDFTEKDSTELARTAEKMAALKLTWMFVLASPTASRRRSRSRVRPPAKSAATSSRRPRERRRSRPASPASARPPTRPAPRRTRCCPLPRCCRRRQGACAVRWTASCHGSGRPDGPTGRLNRGPDPGRAETAGRWIERARTSPKSPPFRGAGHPWHRMEDRPEQDKPDREACLERFKEWL